MSNWKITPTDQMRALVAGQIQDGDTMELMVKFKVEGKDWCITEIEGQNAPGYNQKKRKEGGDVAAAYSAAMQPSPAPAVDGAMGGDDGAT